jgi:hypothetical protein
MQKQQVIFLQKLRQALNKNQRKKKNCIQNDTKAKTKEKTMSHLRREFFEIDTLVELLQNVDHFALQGGHRGEGEGFELQEKVNLRVCM